MADLVDKLADEIIQDFELGRLGRTYKKSKHQQEKEATTPGRRKSDYYARNRIKILQKLASGKRRELRLMSRYGMTIEQYNLQLEKQGNRCGICKGLHPGRNGWCVDHSHTSKRVRGLLCTHCNTMLGLARDNPDFLQAGAMYIRLGGFQEEWKQPYRAEKP